MEYPAIFLELRGCFGHLSTKTCGRYASNCQMGAHQISGYIADPPDFFSIIIIISVKIIINK